MANVSFKRGMQASLEALTNIEDGVFYLTTDTHKLYIGQDGELALLNECIKMVDYVENAPEGATQLPAANAVNAGELYYVKNGNIFCVSDGNSWNQINPNTDTKVTGAKVERISRDENGINYTLTLSRKDVSDVALTALTADFSISKEDIGSVVSGASVGLEVSSGNNAVNVKASGTGSDTTKFISFSAGEGIQVSANNGTISIVNTDPNQVQKITVDGIPTDVSDSIEVYSADKVDEKIEDSAKKLGAVRYSGVADSALPTTSTDENKIETGAMYLASADFAQGSESVKKGDMMIASVDPETKAITWHRIPSGDEIDTDTQYSMKAANNAIVLENSVDEAKKDTVSFNSSSLNISTNSNTISIDMQWGEF